MPYKYGKRTREFLGAFLFPCQSSFPRFLGVFNKTIIPLALVGYKMIIANSALRASLAIYHLISNARSCIVLYGMVWYGMVWYGIVWYGMVWYGMVSYSACM